jgi:RNA polymerase sigma factor (sigma-70 family)
MEQAPTSTVPYETERFETTDMAIGIAGSYALQSVISVDGVNITVDEEFNSGMPGSSLTEIGDESTALKYQIDQTDQIDQENRTCSAHKNQQSDPHIEEKLMQENMGLVVNTAKKYAGCGLDMDDLIQEGCIGLMQAIRSFESDRGIQFSTFAAKYIGWAISRAVIYYGKSIRIPFNATLESRRIYNHASKLEVERGCKPTEKEVIDSYIESNGNAVSHDHVRTLLRMSRNTISLNIPVSPGDSDRDTHVEIGDLVIDRESPSVEDEVIDRGLLVEEIRSIIDEFLSEQEKFVCVHYFGFNNEQPKTLEEVGEMLGGMSRQRASQIKQNIILRLKNHRKFKHFIDYIKD